MNIMGLHKRTGQQILFDLNRSYSFKTYQIWSILKIGNIKKITAIKQVENNDKTYLIL
jgi:hypothetical protein